MMQRLVALAVALPSIALGQTVRGVVTLPAESRPLSGVVVMLLDSTGTGVARSLSNEQGEYRVTASRAGVYRVRTLRIGYKPQTSAAIRLADGETVELPLAMASLPVSLDTVRVAGRNACRATGDTVVATYAIWEQVRGALSAAQVTASSAELSVNLMSYERTIDPLFRSVRKQSTSFAQSLSVVLWRSASADELRRRGYVVDDMGGSKTYLAPDLDVLLSAEFVEDHCMRLARASGPTLIGIEFEPNKDRDKIPEIRGTVWVDRATAELRSMDFRYENLTVSEIEARPGGQMEFLRFKDGGWVIARWNIRMPIVTTVADYSGSGGIGTMFRQDKQRVNEIRVAGGEVISVLKGADTVFARAPLSLAGEVVDSLSRIRIAGARVVIRGTPLSSTTDRNGLFFIGNLLPGDYGLDIHTPSLDSVGGSYATTVTVADPSSRLRFNVPSGDDYAAEFCPSTADSTKASGYVLGSVRLEGDTTPPWNVAVTASWQDGKETRTASSRTDALGRYRMCGVAIARDLTFRSELDDTSAAQKRLRIPGRKRFAVVNFTIPKPAVVTGTLFAGTVATEWSREPLADAEVVIADVNISVRTNAQGRFRIAGVAPGTHRVSARKVGYAATELDVTFAGSTPIVRQFLLGGVTALDPVRVTAAVLPDFEERRKLGAGRFVTRAELAKTEGRMLADVLREVPAMDLVMGRGSHYFPRSNRQIRNTDPNLPIIGGNEDNIYCGTTPMELMQGVLCQCYAQVYLDKMLLNPGRPTPAFDASSFAPEHLEAIEWYPSQSEMPMEYQRRGASCGVLVLHTRRTKY